MYILIYNFRDLLHIHLQKVVTRLTEDVQDMRTRYAKKKKKKLS